MEIALGNRVRWTHRRAMVSLKEVQVVSWKNDGLHDVVDRGILLYHRFVSILFPINRA